MFVNGPAPADRFHTFEAGTTILFHSAPERLLAADRGGRLVAVDTATHPVVFTSDKPVGSGGRGDWGGIILQFPRKRSVRMALSQGPQSASDAGWGLRAGAARGWCPAVCLRYHDPRR